MKSWEKFWITEQSHEISSTFFMSVYRVLEVQAAEFGIIRSHEPFQILPGEPTTSPLFTIIVVFDSSAAATDRSGNHEWTTTLPPAGKKRSGALYPAGTCQRNSSPIGPVHISG
jgi:hypothetical protein